MIDKWIQQDLDQKLSNRQLVVILDPERQLDQLIPLWETEAYCVKVLDDSLAEEWQRIREELFLRVDIERNEKEKIIIYSTRTKNQLSFLYDYTETHGCIDLSQTEEWLRRKLFSETGLQVQLSKDDLLTAAKASIGKDINWWKSVIQKLIEVVSLDDIILPLLNNPEEWEKKQAVEVLTFVRKKLLEFTNQPNSDKSLSVLAEEVVTQIFNNIINDQQKEDVIWYKKWLDSNQYKSDLISYLKKFKLPDNINHWKINANHCFCEIDQLQLKDVINSLHNTAFKTKYLPLIKKRADNRKNPLVPKWWSDILVIISFNAEKIAKLKSFTEIVNYYTEEYYKLDRAIRNLYEQFLNDESIIKPIQEYYQSINQELIDKWFIYKQDYKSNQQGHLVNLIKNNDKKIAIIVGDGVRWEIAEMVVSKIDKDYEVQKDVMLADLPSETEHNMSALYVGNNRVLKIQSDREKQLVALTGKEICFKKLSGINAAIQDELLVLTYKDVDDAGEKLQQDAIKLFKEFENLLKEKIELLLRSGYEEVYLVSDHGFVLTGLLTEADKIDISISGTFKTSERYIRSEEEQHNDILWSIPQTYDNFNYLNLSQADRPFRTPGVYGFSHGGFTPQEIIIPNFKFTKKTESQASMLVFISNKDELKKDILGENFKIKLSSKSKDNNIFDSQRYVNIILYNNNVLLERTDRVLIKKGEHWDKDYSFEGNQSIQVIIEDASSKERLDQVTVNKSSARDLGGLF